jgi:hypothetical protein
VTVLLGEGRRGRGIDEPHPYYHVKMRVFLSGICRRATKSQNLRNWANGGS